MKRTIILIAALCLLLTGCAFGRTGTPAESNTTPAPAATQAPTAEVPDMSGRKITPLPDTTMENLTDAILAVSLEEGGVYVDENGVLCMELTIYTYDRYDMVDMATLEVGDVLITREAQVPVKEFARSDSGALLINGGLENGGFDLYTDDSGSFYEQGFSDVKSWYALDKKSFQVSDAFAGTDSADLDLGEVALTYSSFAEGQIANYDFTPHNTTVRLEGGRIVALNRVYTP